MSKNKNVNYAQYVHPFVDEHGVTHFAVAQQLKGLAQGMERYIIPLSRNQVKLTGKSSVIIDDLQSLGGYPTRKQALRRARYLFGGK